jgi:hypothetical protein
MLDDVTLCCIDTAQPLAAVRALEQSAAQCGFAAVVFLTDREMIVPADALRAMLGFGVMLLALHLAVRPWGVTTALVVALLVSAFWSAALLLLGRPTRPRKDRFKPGSVNARPPSPPFSSPRLTRISGLCCRAWKPPPANTE